jgi:2-keto-4-pentenoate hydratase
MSLSADGPIQLDCAKGRAMDLQSTQQTALAKTTIDQVAESLFAARGAGKKIATPSEVLRLADAYAIQDALTRLGRGAAAWKTSLPQPNFAALGIYEMAVCAPILKDNVHLADGGRSVVVREPVGGPAETVGLELEVAYKLGRDFPASLEAPDAGDVLAGIASAYIAVEVCGARWSNASPPFLWMLADSMMNRNFVLGEPLPGWETLEFAALTARQSLNGKLLQETTGGHKSGNPLGLVVWQVQHCVRHRGGISAGTIITTGQLCGNQWVKPEGTIRGEFPALGRAIEFELTA